jgi:XPA protein C-terminus
VRIVANIKIKMETLTNEQRERIRINRERALEIRRKRLREEEEKKVTAIGSAVDDANEKQSLEEKSYAETNNSTTTLNCITTDNEIHNYSDTTKRIKLGTDNITENDTSVEELEDFEINASQYVTKNDAMKLYCLPEGTIAVCKCIMEKINPRNPNFTSMKLYSRSEIRQRAYKRYGGLVGLQAERNKRLQKQYEKNLEASKQIFS